MATAFPRWFLLVSILYLATTCSLSHSRAAGKRRQGSVSPLGPSAYGPAVRREADPTVGQDRPEGEDANERKPLSKVEQKLQWALLLKILKPEVKLGVKNYVIVTLAKHKADALGKLTQAERKVFGTMEGMFNEIIDRLFDAVNGKFQSYLETPAATES